MTTYWLLWRGLPSGQKYGETLGWNIQMAQKQLQFALDYKLIKPGEECEIGAITIDDRTGAKVA